MATRKQPNRGLMAAVLGRMSAGESLINDIHAQTMLVSFLQEADRVEDPQAAWNEVRQELAESWGFSDGPDGPTKPFVYQDGVAVIPAHGILINRFNYCWGFVTGYDFIRKQMNLADADPDVQLIVFDHDTPGGEAAGCDELARDIRSLDTPTMALVNTLSCSGGYWLAAPCTRIVCAPSGTVGSIGVYIQHMNIQKFLAEFGIELEYIKNTDGKFKTSGNPYESLSKDDRAYLQGMVDERADEFFAAVAEFRGIEESVVKGTQARVMRPTEALSLGLIDAAEAPSTAVATFIAELGNEEPIVAENEEEVTMAEMSSEDRAAVAKETRDRIKGIMTHDEAKGREGLAEHLAYNTDMSVADAGAMLAAAPKKAEVTDTSNNDGEGNGGGNDDGGDGGNGEGNDGGNGDGGNGDGGNGEGNDGDKAKGKSKFEQAMDQGNHPNVGPNVNGEGGTEDATAASIDRILGAQAAATGRRFDKAKA